MTKHPECEIRICREPAYERTACGLWLCPDHKREHEDQQQAGDREFDECDHWPDKRGNLEVLTREEHRQKHIDEFGRNSAVMRRARAL